MPLDPIEDYDEIYAVKCPLCLVFLAMIVIAFWGFALWILIKE